MEVRTDSTKIIQTVWLFLAYFLPGISDAVLGPTLLDLKLLINSDMDAFNYVILGCGIGASIGSVLAGFLATEVDVKLRLAINILVASLVNTVIPLVPSYPYVLIMFILQGIGKGFAACYIIEMCNSLWQEKGVAFQFVLCGATTGAIIAPLVAKPFLCHKADNNNMRNISQSKFNHTGNETADEGAGVCTAEDTNVAYAYVILGFATLPCAFAMFYYWLTARKFEPTETSSPYKTLESSTNISSPNIYYAFLTVLFLFYLPVIGLMIAYSTFLTAYGVQGSLQMSKEAMVFMTSLFWGCSLIGRIVNTALTAWCGNLKIIVTNFLGLLLSAVLLVIFGQTSEPLLWISTAGIGLFFAPYLGAGLAWCASQITFTSRVIALCFFSVGVGNMVLPYLAGVLFNGVGVNGHIYLLLGGIIFMIVMFICLACIGRKLEKKESVIKLTESST